MHQKQTVVVHMKFGRWVKFLNPNMPGLNTVCAKWQLHKSACVSVNKE